MTPIFIQIQRWMMHTKVWRFVGFASSIVGLLCYTHSIRFNHLFGNWNLMNIFLYTIFSFIICLIILFARTWQHSTSLRFKARSAFLVLTITSVYSFFSDKVMNGKPDAYSLISCAAFAIMSLSLSRQIQCGFEVDLMYFYLGCLIVQLMKFNLLLAIAGVCYSYCLIILRSSFTSFDVTPENHSLGPEEQLVAIQVDSQQRENSNSGCVLQHFYTDLERLLQQFLTCMKELQKNNSNIEKMLLEKVKGNYKLVVADHNFIIDALSHETINNLQETAKLMVDAGFEKVCYEAYNTFRNEWLKDLLKNKLLRLGKIGFQDYVIGRWIKTSEVALRVLFPSERRLYSCVFSNSTSASSDLHFSEICHGATIELLNFADSFANRSPSAWRLFKILNLLETLCDLIPEFESLFHDSLVNEAIKIKNRLGEICRGIFMEFGDMIFLTSEAEFDCWVDGGVHPMTCAAIGYTVMAFWSRKNLEQILRAHPMVVTDAAETCLFYSQMELIMEQFERKLETKSQAYGDLALRYLFMINNLYHVKSGLETFWDDRFCINMRKYFELYCRSSWNKVINILEIDIKESVVPNSKIDSMIKDKLNLFNQKFKEMCGIQSKWRVFDEQLRKQMIMFIESILLPAYENFISMFRNVVGKNEADYIEYEMSDIQDQLNKSFLLQHVC
ncbi:unnamed protein product [Lathyrus oleraceus]